MPQRRSPGDAKTETAGEGAGADGGSDFAPVQTNFRGALTAARDDASLRYLVALMRQFGGNVTQAAALAGMTRENLHRLLRKYGVQSETFKRAPRPDGEPER